MRSNLICITLFMAALGVAGCQSAANSDAPAAAKDTASAKPVEEFHEVTIPEGTTLSVALDDAVGSATSRVDDPVRAHLTRPVSVDGAVALPEGTAVSGAVVEALRSGRVKGRARVGIRFDKVRVADESYSIRTAAITREAAGQVKKDAMKVGIPAAAGAVLGGILGGGKGAAIGAGVGGGGGAAYVMSERGSEVSLGRGATVSVRLAEPIKVRVRTSSNVVVAN